MGNKMRWVTKCGLLSTLILLHRTYFCPVHIPFVILEIDLIGIINDWLYIFSNKNRIKSNENAHKKVRRPYDIVSINKAPSVTLNVQSTETRENMLQFCDFDLGSRLKDLNKSNGFQITKVLAWLEYAFKLKINF